MLFLLFGLLNASFSDYHKDIKILTPDRKYELTVTNENVFKRRLMFLPASMVNSKENIFTYDSLGGGIKTMYNQYLSKTFKETDLMRYITPLPSLTNANKWKITGLGDYNKIKNEDDYCFKLGDYNKKLKAYSITGVKCTVNDKSQKFVVIEIPNYRGDPCQLLNIDNTSCHPNQYETLTDVKNRPILK